LLLRAGVSTVVIPDGADPKVWDKALGQYQVAYQSSAEADQPLSLFRRKLAVAAGH
jgi:uncharacterized protein (DUF934 family)